MTLRARVGSLEKHDVVIRESLRISRGKITRSQLRAEYTKQEVRELREFRVTDRLAILELRNRAKIEQIVAQRVANAMDIIAIYEAKSHVARDLMNRVEWQKDKEQRMLAIRGSGKVTDAVIVGLLHEVLQLPRQCT
nr:hypothetical protein [Tanacetum cinerariifolium]